MPKTIKSQPKKETAKAPAAGNNQICSDEELYLVWAERNLSSMLVGDEVWHRRIAHILTAVGFDIRRMEREEAHPIWHVWLTRNTFNLDPETAAASKQIRAVLRHNGIKIKRDEFTIIDWRGDKLRCTFMFESGAAGILRPSANSSKNRELHWLPTVEVPL